MDISVTDFKAHCLDLIRKVEAGATVTIKPSWKDRSSPGGRWQF
jgi:hypothetical protein